MDKNCVPLIVPNIARVAAMSWSIGDIRSMLQSLGFVEEKPGDINFGTTFTLGLSKTWHIMAYAARRDGWQDIEMVTFGLCRDRVSGQWKGTQHRIHNQDALAQHASDIVKALRDLESHQERLICPKCKRNYVHVKDPGFGDKFQSFLSCDGMQVVPRTPSRSKHIACNGVSKLIPACIHYPSR